MGEEFLSEKKLGLYISSKIAWVVLCSIITVKQNCARHFSFLLFVRVVQFIRVFLYAQAVQNGITASTLSWKKKLVGSIWPELNLPKKFKVPIII